MTLAKLKLNGHLAADVEAAREAGAVAPPPDTAMIPVTDLRIDVTYQRSIGKRGHSIIRKIIRGFDWMRFGVLIVGKTGDIYAVIDGQHRAVAARHLGIPAVPCFVRDMDGEQQAGTFLGINLDRSTVGAIDRFRAQVAAGDARTVEIDQVLKRNDITLDTSIGVILDPRALRSIASVNQIYMRFGADGLDGALALLIETQPDAPNLLTGFNLHSVVRVRSRVIDCDGDLDRLRAAIVDTDFEDLKDRAAAIKKVAGGKVYCHGAALLTKRYNAALQSKSRLSEAYT